MACPIALLTTHDILNAGDGSPSVVGSGGVWTLEDAPSFPANLNFGTLTITTAGDSVPSGDNPVIDFTAAVQGVYVFQYDTASGTGGCPGDATLTITVIEGAWAGNNVQIDICEEDGPVNLFQLLVDNNDPINPPVTPAGSWTVTPTLPAGVLNSGTGTYTPAVGDGTPTGTTYTFEYTAGVVGADPNCDNCQAVSQIDITVYTVPELGDDVTINLCP